MQVEETDHEKMYGHAPDAPLLPGEQESVRARVQAGIAAMDRGDYTVYEGNGGLEKLRTKMTAIVKKAAQTKKG
jgi:hypothetical protein